MHEHVTRSLQHPSPRTSGARALLAWVACAALACGDSSGPEGSYDASASAKDASGCTLPADCISVVSTALTLEACCTPSIECGFDVAHLDDLREGLAARGPEIAGELDGTCWSHAGFFLSWPGQPEQRMTVAGGDDLFTTPDCESRSFWAFQMPGCCLPDNSCAISTHEVFDTVVNLLEDGPGPFERPRCLPPAQLNAELRATSLAGLAHLQDTTGSCDYADLEARLTATRHFP